MPLPRQVSLPKPSTLQPGFTEYCEPKYLADETGQIECGVVVRIRPCLLVAIRGRTSGQSLVSQSVSP